MTLSRVLATAATIVLLPCSLAAQTGASDFAEQGIAWGTPMAQVKDALVLKGWEFDRVDDAGDYEFTRLGPTGGSMLFAYQAQGRLAGVVYQHTTGSESGDPAKSARFLYAMFSAAYAREIGRPAKEYTSGDGNHDAELSLDQAQRTSVWLGPVKADGSRDRRVLQLTNTNEVVISSESASWAAEKRRRGWE